MRMWQTGPRWLAGLGVVLLLAGCSLPTLFGQDPALAKIEQKVKQKVRLVERQSGEFGTVIRYQYGDDESCATGYLYQNPAGLTLRTTEYSGCPTGSWFDQVGDAPATRDGLPGHYYVGLSTDPSMRRVTLSTGDGQALQGALKGHAWYVWVPDGASPPVPRKVLMQGADGQVLGHVTYPLPSGQGPRTALAAVRWQLDVEPTELLASQGSYGDLLAYTYRQDGKCGYGHRLEGPDGSGTAYDTDLIPCGGTAPLDLVGNGNGRGWSLAYGRVHHPAITQVRVRLSDQTEVIAQVRDGAWAASWDGEQGVQALVGLNSGGEVVWQGTPIFVLNAAAQAAQAGRRP